MPFLHTETACWYCMPRFQFLYGHHSFVCCEYPSCVAEIPKHGYITKYPVMRRNILLALCIGVLVLVFSCAKIKENQLRPPTLTLVAAQVQHNYCYGVDVAFIILQANGAIPQAHYRMDNGRWQTSPNFYHVPSGSHVMQVKDGFNRIAEVHVPIVGVSGPPCPRETY